MTFPLFTVHPLSSFGIRQSFCRYENSAGVIIPVPFFSSRLSIASQRSFISVRRNNLSLRRSPVKERSFGALSCFELIVFVFVLFRLEVVNKVCASPSDSCHSESQLFSKSESIPGEAEDRYVSSSVLTSSSDSLA